jgi:ABC-type lipoprotein export system ATPase subunit/ABC-type multidrug transport system permease subunit
MKSLLGKSALIHLLAASNISQGKVNVRGSVNIVLNDGTKLKRCSRCWFDHARIVPHVDHLVPTLKCKQVLDIYLELNGSSKEETNKFLDLMRIRPFATSQVNKFNNQVDLSSRGNLKKLSILQAITSEPSLLLVDEPAYLVDLHNLNEIVKGLKSYASEESETYWECHHCGINSYIPTRKCVIFAFNSILLSLKWPSVIESFDKIILMSSSRQIIFFGNLAEAIEKIGKGSLEGLIEALEDVSLDKKPMEIEAQITRKARKSRYTIPWYKQVWILLKRHWFQVNNAPKQVFRVILQRIVIFIILSFIFAQPKSRASFLGIFLILPINQTANVLLFTTTEGFLVNELEIVESARFGKVYKTWTLMLAKLFILIPINILPAFIYLPALFYIANFQNQSSFIFFYLANILHIACTVPLGLFIASSSQDPFIRDLWLFGITTLFTTFGGIHTAANFQLTWILRWIQYISPTFYLFLILVQLEFTQTEIKRSLILGKFILSVGGAFGALAGLGLLYTLLACISLSLSTRPSRILF